MNKKKNLIVKRTRKEELEFRKLQKAISQLPKPSFNNPDQAQPKVEPQVVVSSSIIQKPLIANEDEKQKVFDPAIILDKPAKRIEKVTKLKKPKSVLKRFFGYTRKNWIYFALSIFCACLNTAFEVLIPLLIGRGIDCIIGVGMVDFIGLTVQIVMLAISILGFATFKWLTNKFAYTLSYKTEYLLHIAIFKKLNKVPLKYLDNSSHGDIQSRMINDVDLITDGFVTGFTSFFDCITTIALTLSLMFMMNVSIATVIVCITPISIIIASIIAKFSNKLFKKQAKAVGDLSGQLVEMLGNQKIVKAFQYEERSIDKFNDINYKLQEYSEKATFYSTLSAPITRFINGILYAIVAIMGTLSAINGLISVGSISTLLSYANKYTKPFNEITDVVSDIQAAYASCVRVFNVLDIEDEISDAGNKELVKTNGKVEFKNVDFSYSPDRKLIQNMNVSVTKGNKVAIVGPTGCGKSTIINLLMRFYDVDSGEIIIGDYPITKVTRGSLRDKFGMVLQETWLFSASIKDNIAYGKKDATDAEIVKAAKLAGAHYFIETMTEGYNTVINENGDNLSQGQKQLICIARLMLTKPDILILDEATSNIDTRTELQIQEAFNKMMKGRTSFVVAHRLSTITSSDLILVMNKGNIIEQGTHKELLAKKGFYYNLYNSQFSNY